MTKINNSWRDGLTKRIRLLAGNNEAAFAKKAGIRDQTFRKYLSGSIPGGDKILLIARAGGVSTDWLLTGEEEPSKIPIETEMEEENLKFTHRLLEKYHRLKSGFDSAISKLQDINKSMESEQPPEGEKERRKFFIRLRQILDAQ